MPIPAIGHGTGVDRAFLRRMRPGVHCRSTLGTAGPGSIAAAKRVSRRAEHHGSPALPQQGEDAMPITADKPLRELLQRIRGEYLEMPGLRLTAEQARRLWSLDLGTCTSLLEALVDAQFLARSRDGKYFRLSHT